MTTDLTNELTKEWLDGTAIPEACGYGPYGPNVQLKRRDGSIALLSLKPVAESLIAIMQREAKLRETLEEISKPALGGKQQQYLAQAILKELYPSEYTETK